MFLYNKGFAIKSDADIMVLGDVKRSAVWSLKQTETLIQIFLNITHTLNCFLSILDSAPDQIEIYSTEFDYEIIFLLNSTLNIIKIEKFACRMTESVF